MDSSTHPDTWHEEDTDEGVLDNDAEAEEGEILGASSDVEWQKKVDSEGVQVWETMLKSSRVLRTKVLPADRPSFYIAGLGPEGQPWDVHPELRTFVKEHLSKLAESVGWMKSLKGGSTASHLGMKLVLTNQHVAKSSTLASHLELTMGKGMPGQEATMPIGSEQQRTAFVRRESTPVDVAIVKMAQMDDRVPGLLEQSALDREQVCRGDILYTLHYGTGILLDDEPALQVTRVTVHKGSSGTEFVKSIPRRFKGASGAPIFNGVGKLVGCHYDGHDKNNLGFHISKQQLELVYKEVYSLQCDLDEIERYLQMAKAMARLINGNRLYNIASSNSMIQQLLNDASH